MLHIHELVKKISNFVGDLGLMCVPFKGHSKSTFVEEGKGVIEKLTKTNRGRGVPSMRVCSLF